ncbi:unnamed protein product [Clonostachys rhizophaga]|uniref:Methyltransferase domain-containing protein n=1 Tax=Clonostachys rhizophaga TaxID=160324 RepID=A0A9N9VJD0_9HYPO|nr:unnamed protein product [Clonostachys rhizophaga]
MTTQTPPENVKARLKASYDAMAPVYNSWTERHNHMRMTYLDELFGRIPKLGNAVDEKSSVLELGCGSGAPFLTTLLERGGPGISVVANDMSDTQIGLARENLAAYGDRVQFEPGDMTKLTFAPKSLTAVVALYSLIHLPQGEQEEMLDKIAEWLEPGGILIANFSFDEMSSGVMESWLHEKGWMFWSGLGMEKTAAKLKQVGFTIEKSEVEGDTQEKHLWIVAKH